MTFSTEPSADDWSGYLDPDVERLRMAFAEAGFPDAHVYVESSGIFVEGVPEAVQERAFDLVNSVPNQGPHAMTAPTEPSVAGEVVHRGS